LALAPEMRFFREETHAESAYRKRYCAEWPMFTGTDQRGHADREDGSIGVRAERHTTRAAAAETAAHEVKHIAQPRHLHRDDAEEDATAYGEWAARLLVKGDRVARVHACVLPPWSEIVRPDHGDIAVYRGPSSGIFKNVGVPFAPRWERTPPYPTGV